MTELDPSLGATLDGPADALARQLARLDEAEAQLLASIRPAPVDPPAAEPDRPVTSRRILRRGRKTTNDS